MRSYLEAHLCVSGSSTLTLDVCLVPQQWVHSAIVNSNNISQLTSAAPPIATMCLCLRFLTQACMCTALLYCLQTVYGRYDDEVRFDFFCKAALEFLLKTGRQPDILHCHDWSTAHVAKVNLQCC